MLMPVLASVVSAEVFTVNVGQFEKLKINGNMTVVYRNLPDSTGMARYESSAGADGVFNFSTKGEGNLRVEPADNRWGNTDLPVLYLYSDFLSSVESYSDQSVDVESVAPCASFNVSLVGNGTITVDGLKCNNLTAAITTGNGSIFISGSCINANFRMVGAGLISADRLSAENVKCRILGTGSIGCWPIDNLNVSGLGTTKIYYKGKPNVKKSGGGKLFELPDETDDRDYSSLGTPVQSFAPVQIDEDDDEDDEDADDEEDYEDDDDYQTIVTSDD